MKHLFFTLLLITGVGYSQVQTGDVIKAVEFNNKTFTIGDIKISILPLVKFQELHGSCWIQLNQGADDSNIDISSTDLATALSSTTIKSATGRALRAQGGLSTTLGATQEDQFQSFIVGSANGYRTQHRSVHASAGGSNGGVYHSGIGGNDYGDVGPFHQNGANGVPRHGNETRMKNLTVNMFIKVNHNCE